jgi:hypothetical protein
MVLRQGPKELYEGLTVAAFGPCTQRVFQEFERICSTKNLGQSVLEVGALPSDESLFDYEGLAGRTQENRNQPGWPL